MSDSTTRFRDFSEEQWHRCFDTDEEWERYCDAKGIDPYPNKIKLDKFKWKERHSD